MGRTDAGHDVWPYTPGPVVEDVFMGEVAMVLVHDDLLLKRCYEIQFRPHRGIHARPAQFDQVLLIDACPEGNTVAGTWINHDLRQGSLRFRWVKGDVGSVSAENREVKAQRFGLGRLSIRCERTKKEK